LLVIQDRDLEVIDYLSKLGWSLAANLSKTFFKSNNRVAFRRLSQLHEKGLLTYVRIRDLNHLQIEKKTRILLFANLSLDHRIYRLSDELLKSRGQKINHSTDKRLIIHQLMCQVAHKHISKLIKSTSYLTDKDYRIYSKGHSFYTSFADEEPDLIIKKNGKKIAIEIERKARRGLGLGNTAYEDRINGLSLDYDLVLYVMENEEHLKKMIDKSIGLSRVGFSSVYNLKSVNIKGLDPLSLDSFLGKLNE